MNLGSIVPNFVAQTTKGPIQFYDWQGDSWVVLFSHPADYTPVCTTELGEIAVRNPEFIKRNVKLLAHSVDSVQSHIDWVNDIKSYCLDTRIPAEFPYPIIADQTRDLAITFGMISEDDRNDPEAAITVRALYIISPDRKVRLVMLYPNGTGRNINEILRCVDSLQLTDRVRNIATPANWTPGSKIMILPTVPDDDVRRLFPRAECVKLPSGRRYMRTISNIY